ncbi:hypothetical protein [Streptomyces sp. NPDC002328]|uniref:hypothetical protein n=1 Tax=Streptomyces sp. NPDC002328 TaxID=3364642 RepID=UPI00367875E6
MLPTGEELARLPGVRGQIERIAADLAAGRTCVWLMPDDLVDQGVAEELHRAVMARWPEQVELPEPAAPAPQTAAWHDEPARPVADVPLLDGFDDGFDIGWDLPTPTPTRTPPTSAPVEGGPSELVTRLAKELSVDPDHALDELTDPAAHWRPVIGIRAWTEPGPRQGGAGRAGERGHDIARLVRALGAAVKEAGLLPDQRPRLMVTGRLGDLPPQLPDECERELGAAAVHWWWGTIGRLDSATLLSGSGGHRDRGRTAQGGAVLRTRVVRAVRAEVIGEVCGADLALAVDLHARWDGSDRSLDDCLRACLAARTRKAHVECPTVRGGAGLQHKPPSGLRRAWADGIVQAWEGRPRLHPALWHSDGGAGRTDRLNALVGLAQARVLMPWIEEARYRLADLALSFANRPAAELVKLHMRARLPDCDARPERTFRCAEAAELQHACLSGHVALPLDERVLLAALVKARNTLSHRDVLGDEELDDLCAKLSAADLRWGRDG